MRGLEIDVHFTFVVRAARRGRIYGIEFGDSFRDLHGERGAGSGRRCSSRRGAAGPDELDFVSGRPGYHLVISVDRGLGGKTGSEYDSVGIGRSGLLLVVFFFAGDGYGRQRKRCKYY